MAKVKYYYDTDTLSYREIAVKRVITTRKQSLGYLQYYLLLFLDLLDSVSF